MTRDPYNTMNYWLWLWKLLYGCAASLPLHSLFPICSNSDCSASM